MVHLFPLNGVAPSGSDRLAKETFENFKERHYGTGIRKFNLFSSFHSELPCTIHGSNSYRNHE